MKSLAKFPLMILAAVAVNVIAFSGANETDALFNVPMPSGASWALTLHDLVLSGALVLFFIEVVKSTRTGSSTIYDHSFSLVVAIACLVEFMVVPAAAFSSFFAVTFLCFLDVVAGFSITINSARRDFGAVVQA